MSGLPWTKELKQIAAEIETKRDPETAADIVRDLARQVRELSAGTGRELSAAREMLDELRALFGQYKFETAGKIEELEGNLEEQRTYISALDDSLLRPDGEAARFWAQSIREERAAENG